MARLAQIVIDSSRPATLARFWAQVLDGFEVRPYDDEEVARLASLGRTPETDPSVILDGPMFEMCFQEIDVAVSTKRPIHLDLTCDDRASEQERLVALGATVVDDFATHTWMRDPEGNDFCLVDG